MRLTAQVIERFLSLIRKQPSTGCWYSRQALIHVTSRRRLPARTVAWHMSHPGHRLPRDGEGKPHIVIHLCGNPKCCNPEHLTTRPTQAAHQRVPWETAIELHSRYWSGETNLELLRKDYRFSRKVMSSIIHTTGTYKNLEREKRKILVYTWEQAQRFRDKYFAGNAIPEPLADLYDEEPHKIHNLRRKASVNYSKLPWRTNAE